MPAETNKPTDSDALPIRAVTLFSSGVAYLLREGTVPSGEASVPLTFRTGQVSDLLKSMVLLDEGGTVRPAVYPSQDPIGRTLQTFAVDVTENQSRADILRSLRGAEIRVQTFAGETLEGRIFGVETRDEYSVETRSTLRTETLSLLTTEGLTALDLARVRVLRLLDARLDQELRDALIMVASRADDDRRTITLGFFGAEERSVQVGYLMESPLWKVSYRLVLTEGEEASVPTSDQPVVAPAAVASGPAFAPHLAPKARVTPPEPVVARTGNSGYLQGWAIVDNTSGDDWTGVRLSLVAGRPSSFIQNLYQPLYVPRPVVAPDVQTSPDPQVHAASIEMPPPAPSMAAAATPSRYSLEDDAPRGFGGQGAMRAKLSSAAAERSVSAQAAGSAKGEQFAYEIDTPVTLPSQQAAMIPIVSKSDIPVEKLSLYNAHGAGDPRHPWNAVRITNDTALHLKGGPITLFDAGTYAGEARMEDLPPGDSRLLTYGVDLLVDGERQNSKKQAIRETHRLTIRGGILNITKTRTRSETYVLKSKAKEPRQVLIEHPFDAQWKLSEPATAAERTDIDYRFAVTLAPGETQTLAVVEEQPYSETIRLIEHPTDQFAMYVTAGHVSLRIKNALRPVIEARRRVEEIDTLIASCQADIVTLTDEQKRLRENLAAVREETPLHRRFLADLEKQENRLALLHEEVTAHKIDRESEAARLREYVDSLDVE